MKLVDCFFTFHILWNIVKDVSCVCHVFGGMRSCHGNNVFVVDVTTKLFTIMTLVITKTVAQEHYSALNATT